MLHYSTEQTGVHTEEVDLDPGEPVLITVELIKEEGESGRGGAIEVCFKEVEGGAAVRSALKYGPFVKLIFQQLWFPCPQLFFCRHRVSFGPDSPTSMLLAKVTLEGPELDVNFFGFVKKGVAKKITRKKLFNDSSRSGFSHSVAVGEGVHWACPEGQKFSHNVFIRYSCILLYAV